MKDLGRTHFCITFIVLLGGGNQKVALLKPRFQEEKIENIELCGQEKGLVLGLSLLVKYHLIWFCKQLSRSAQVPREPLQRQENYSLWYVFFSRKKKKKMLWSLCWKCLWANETVSSISIHQISTGSLISARQYIKHRTAGTGSLTS